MSESDLRAIGERIEALLSELQASTEGRVWMRIEELVRLLTELYGEGIGRVVDLLADQPTILQRLAADELVGNLLILHDLHPDDLAARAARAVEGVVPTLRSAGGDARLTDVDPDSGRVTVTVTSSGGGCGSTAGALRETVADAMAGAVPDALIEVLVETLPAATPVRLGRKPAPAPAEP